MSYSFKTQWFCGQSLHVTSVYLLTAVATRMGHFPDLNWLRASSRSLWERSPWILVQAYPSRYRKSSNASAPFFVSTKTRVNESFPRGQRKCIWCSIWPLLSTLCWHFYILQDYAKTNSCFFPTSVSWINLVAIDLDDTDQDLPPMLITLKKKKKKSNILLSLLNFTKYIYTSCGFVLYIF